MSTPPSQPQPQYSQQQPPQYGAVPGQYPQQQPYGQQPYPQQGPYGQGPYMPLPPKKKFGTGKIIAIVAAAVVGGLVLLGGGVALLASTAEEGAYEVTLPEKLDGGKLSLSQEMTDQFAGKRGAPDKVLAGLYSDETDQLLYIGAEESRDDAAEFLDDAKDADGTSAPVERREITPSGSDEPMQCQVLQKEQLGQTVTMPMCAWSEKGVLVSVTGSGSDTVTKAPEDIDLEALAARTEVVRQEVLVPKD